MCVCGVNDIQSDREYDARNAWLIIIFFFWYFFDSIIFSYFQAFFGQKSVRCLCMPKMVWTMWICRRLIGRRTDRQPHPNSWCTSINVFVANFESKLPNFLCFSSKLFHRFFLVVFGLACYSLLNRLDNVCVCVYVMRVIAKNRLISISFVSFSVLELILGWNG